jgi:hypothetical protein
MNFKSVPEYKTALVGKIQDLAIAQYQLSMLPSRTVYEATIDATKAELLKGLALIIKNDLLFKKEDMN